MTKKRQSVDLGLWQSITNLDYDAVMQNRNLYYAGVKNQETRQACSIYKIYRYRLSKKRANNDT